MGDLEINIINHEDETKILKIKIYTWAHSNSKYKKTHVKRSEKYQSGKKKEKIVSNDIFFSENLFV